jgi:hypothetical protein
MGDVTERLPLVDPLEHGCPRGGRDLPARIRYSLRVARQRHKQRIVKGRGERIFLGRGSGSVFLVDQQIASARAEFFKGDACQGRSMGRCPSVPVRLFMHLSSNYRTYVLSHSGPLSVQRLDMVDKSISHHSTYFRLFSVSGQPRQDP